VALPHRRQHVAVFIKYHDLTYRKVADAVGIEYGRFSNIVKGNAYPSPDEVAALSDFFQMPPQVLFEPALLSFQLNWPPKPGPRPGGKAGESDA